MQDTAASDRTTKIAVTIVLIGVVFVTFFLVADAVHLINQHFHLGYNAATDTECRSLIVQWCR